MFLVNISINQWFLFLQADPVDKCILKVSNRITSKVVKYNKKFTMKTPERRHWRYCGVFIVNFERIWHLFLRFLLLSLDR